MWRTTGQHIGLFLVKGLFEQSVMHQVVPNSGVNSLMQGFNNNLQAKGLYLVQGVMGMVVVSILQVMGLYIVQGVKGMINLLAKGFKLV